MNGLKRYWNWCSREGWMSATKTPSMHHPWRGNVTSSVAVLKRKSHTRKNLTSNDKSKRYSWVRRRRRRGRESNLAGRWVASSAVAVESATWFLVLVLYYSRGRRGGGGGGGGVCVCGGGRGCVCVWGGCLFVIISLYGWGYWYVRWYGIWVLWVMFSTA